MEARRRAGFQREQLVTPSPPAFPTREHLRAEAEHFHAPMVRSDLGETDKTVAVLARDTGLIPTDDTETEQANDWQ